MNIVVRKSRSAVTRLRNLVVSARFGVSPSALYDDEYYDHGGFDKTEDTARAISTYLNDRFQPATVLDMGCGTGQYLAHFASRGCRAVGVDGSRAGVRRVDQSVLAIQHDLRTPFLMNQKFDLVMSVEVAEHIPKKFSGILVESICTHATSRVVFTAAPPGTGGKDHINCRPRDFWDTLFRKHGFVFDREEAACLIRHAEQHATAEWFQKWAYVYVARPAHQR